MTYALTTQKQIRDIFWWSHPHYDEQARAAGIRSKRQNEHCAAMRCAFVDFVDMLNKNGDISDALAERVTL
jgi:hypothetical protein